MFFIGSDSVRGLEIVSPLACRFENLEIGISDLTEVLMLDCLF